MSEPNDRLRAASRKRLALTESVMMHMLADLDQIVTEMEMDINQRPIADWLAMLRYTVEGQDYKR
jgi:hypothetical protein